jgi:uncharacterized protein (TIGR02246 family)
MEPAAMPSTTNDADAIAEQVAARADAWTRGDAHAFTANLQDNGTFTNIVGTVMRGREDFERRMDEILATVFQGSRMQSTVRHLRFIRPDVAIVDVDSEISNFRSLPGGVHAHDGVLRARSLWVMSKEQGKWSMAAFHNVDVKTSAQD